MNVDILVVGKPILLKLGGLSNVSKAGDDLGAPVNEKGYQRELESQNVTGAGVGMSAELSASPCDKVENYFILIYHTFERKVDIKLD